VHIDTTISGLKAKGHDVREPRTRFGVTWLTIDKVSATEEQARFFLLGRITLDQIHKQNQKPKVATNRRSPMGRRSVSKR
jgi:hypothetical protein